MNTCNSCCPLSPSQLGHRQYLPGELMSDYEKNDEFLKKVHRVLLEVKISQTFLWHNVNGATLVPECCTNFGHIMSFFLRFFTKTDFVFRSCAA